MLTLEFVKSKSTAALKGLHPVVLSATIKLIDRSFAKGIPIVITQGYRSIAEQNALYAQGRTKPGKIVTNAPGGRSLHNYGVAIDFALLLPDGKQVSWDMLRDGNRNGRRDWDEIVEIAKNLGFEWGGDWKTFVDTPHFQITFGLTLNDYAAGRRPSAKQVEAALQIINAKEEPELDKINVEVNGKAIAGGLLDAKSGVTYVPLRAVGEALGAKVEYDKASNTARVTK